MTSFQLLSFISNPKLVVLEIKRVLKPDGLFITNGSSVRESNQNDICLAIRKCYGDELKKRGINEYRTSQYSDILTNFLI